MIRTIMMLVFWSLALPVAALIGFPWTFISGDIRLLYRMFMVGAWNGVLDPNENDGDANPPTDNMDGTLDPGLLEYVTVYTREPTTTRSGTCFSRASTIFFSSRSGRLSSTALTFASSSACMTSCA